MSWTDEKVTKLKELWGKGNTASQIAEIIGGISRNAVIGKAHRLNLSAKIKTRTATSSKNFDTSKEENNFKNGVKNGVSLEYNKNQQLETIYQFNMGIVYKKEEIICAFQPHRISRLNDLRREFSSAFKDSNKVILCPIYTHLRVSYWE